MRFIRRSPTYLALFALICLCASSQLLSAQTPAPSGRAVGSVKAISGNTVTISTDAGAELKVTVADSARLLQLEPGQKDLKDAIPLQLPDIQAGDRVLARGKMSDDGKTLDAYSLIVMKQASISQKQQKDREEWQRNSVGGLVKDIDGGAKTVTITVGAGPTSKTVLIRTSTDTIVRRYAPNSIKFDDAKKSTLAEIKPGDQLRARGTKNADGTEINAQEVVSGSFKNIAGTVQAVNADDKTLTVMDLATKQSVTVKVTADSQMHQLPAMMAQRIAMRLKGTPPEGSPAGASSGSVPPTAAAQPPATPGQGWSGHVAAGETGGGPAGNGGGPPDLQRMLSRTPTVSLADLKKGDAVMIVSSEGPSGSPVTAITLLSGVEPILTASPDSGKAAMVLSPWSLGGPGMDATAQ